MTRWMVCGPCRLGLAVLGLLATQTLGGPPPAAAGEDKPVTGWIAELRQRAGKVEPVADTQPSGAGP